MKISDLKEKKITVMGLGLHGGGVGTVRFLCEAGANVIVTDLKSKEELSSSLEKIKHLKNVSYFFQQHRPENFTNTDMVVKSPPVPWNNKYIKIALEKKIPVETDSSLFFKFCKNPIIGITGTKGKTTTATLIYEILKKSGKNPVMVGIGQNSVLDKLLNLKSDNSVVFELSSWRLSALGRIGMSPDFAVITNIYPDHLNYYKSITEYIRDKKNIFLYQNKKNFCILNEDNKHLNDLEGEIKSCLIKFSKNKKLENKGVYLENEILYFNNGLDRKKIMDKNEIGIRGEHNLENVLAACATTISFGVDLENVRKAVSEFKGVEHRLELVRELNGVKYINDTSATTPDAAMFALESFKEPIILICGGSDKNLDMSVFGEKILEKTKGVIFLKGKATDKIISSIKKTNPDLEIRNFQIVESMEKALELAKLSAESGDIVLLSPGSASFGLFLNEFDRGNKFKKFVLDLK
jgi:UDP-N-acetylmuramoylalanine--D-glutamate ligase